MKNQKYRRSVSGKRTRTYNTYRAMLERCYMESKSNYKYYGAKGVEVCERWRKSYKDFVDDMGKRPDGKTLDRIEVSKGYSLENCRWATAQEQSINSSVSKLNLTKVRRIRSSKNPPAYFAERYNVSISCIKDVINFKTWKFV